MGIATSYAVKEQAEEGRTFSVLWQVLQRQEEKYCDQSPVSLEWMGSCGGDKIVMDGPGEPWKINDTLLILLRELINPFKRKTPLDELPLQ